MFSRCCIRTQRHPKPRLCAKVSGSQRAPHAQSTGFKTAIPMRCLSIRFVCVQGSRSPIPSRAHSARCASGRDATSYHHILQVWQMSIYRFWSDSQTTASRLRNGTVAWGGCYPHMQIIHKGVMQLLGRSLGHDARQVVRMHGPSPNGRASATAGGTWQSGLATCPTPPLATSVCSCTAHHFRRAMHVPSSQIPRTTTNGDGPTAPSRSARLPEGPSPPPGGPSPWGHLSATQWATNGAHQ